MKNNTEIKVALIGNPNTGKTSIFNELTGLRHRVGNYPGVTVDKKMGVCKLSQNQKCIIYDLPGTYSLNYNSLDEKVTLDALMDRNSIEYPDVVVFVADVENLKRNLLLFTQIKDLNIPIILVINMCDRMRKRGITIDVPLLEEKLKTKIVLVSTRNKDGIDKLKSCILEYSKLNLDSLLDIRRIDPEYFETLYRKFPNDNLYKLWVVISQNIDDVDKFRENKISTVEVKNFGEIKKLKQKDTINRYIFINDVLKETYKVNYKDGDGLRERFDKVLLHPFWGYVFFCGVLLLMFQMIYYVSQYPMEMIESLFLYTSDKLEDVFPEGPFSDLLLNGVIPGISGIAVFIPQIAILFLFISILEESGYMSRVVFLMDRIMRPFGLSGKSIIPLISSAACAVPAIMSTRSIENWRQRLITILVTPFITCSARLPVYLIIIALVIPEGRFLIFGYKGIALFSLYIAGVLMAISCSWLLNKVISKKSKSKNCFMFIIEMPSYKTPMAKNVAVFVYNKTKAFVVVAGRIILAISVIIWFLQNHGFSEQYKNAEEYSINYAKENKLSEEERLAYVEGYKIQNSLLGSFGKTISPVFEPLGYDWKISIAILSSFAAREVFVSTLTTIYSLGPEISEDDDQQYTIINRMRMEKREDGSEVFSLATGISILIFYAFAMQCFSTMATVRKETNGWKWPIIQWVFMTGIAYIFSLIAYTTLS